ncbi:MAG: hypothetical protein ACP5NP_16005 [Acetobacteraceae bacterium]
MNRLLLLSAIMAVCGAHAAAARNSPAILAAERKAASFLIGCHQPTASRQRLCQQNQAEFIAEYVRAYSGELLYISDLAGSYSLAGHGNLLDVGFPVDQSRSCSWRLVYQALDRSRSGTPLDLSMSNEACGALDPIGFHEAIRRAARILQRLQSAPLHLPAADWWPSWRELSPLLESHPKPP